jgi:hypothetical protein
MTTMRQAWTAGPTIEASADDRAAIRSAAVDYCRGWFEADPDAMQRAIHPALAKFSVDAGPGAPPRVDVLGFEAMVEATAAGHGVARAGSGRIEISILGVSGSIACVDLRVDAYVEFLLLVRAEEGWRIVSSAWRWSDGAGPRASE